ncbi:UDP-N-acetylmuramate dehydrogenase [Heliophilum fasciatum]|uniref:UDP-N-acetylenolpyruvoylglucosamine reductase n=1 Tax=Heliophilum fasciatum TaxID=35700 RepID=A0A4R2REZ8_9FIRM|nr:UDP-N-acetylmuramate dehydrogenase [Heliophilum fasciatum]MCW2278858.1 UDP-N-acetylmuramate dehydrogenase [Heliophilum fasciatum]TCP62130.1 UDP-N-acetylmuramate dehydrogenase [Heliophilum fasciatum]
MPVTEVLKGFRGRWREQEPLAGHTTWRIGGPADLYVLPLDRQDLVLIVQNCLRCGVPWTVLGAGSNVLIADQGIRGVVIGLADGFRYKQRSGYQVTAGAAVGLPGLARWTVWQGLAGLEFAAGIPASLGGAVMMNAGAHGAAVGERVLAVELVNEHGAIETVAAEELQFTYRHSRLQKRRCIVTEVQLQLTDGVVADMEAAMAKALARRRATQPLEWPNAGSVFLNPPGDSAGRLIEAAGLKGYRIGGAEVSNRHANFIVNAGGATATDVLALIALIQQRVLAASGVELCTEIQLVGDTGRAE